MKHTIHYALLLLLLILAGCEKAPINSKVEGFWKVREITVLSTGETTTCKDMYYSITRMVTEMRGPDMVWVIARTEYREGETLLVFKDFKVRGDTSDTGEDAALCSLLPYGIHSQEETVFRIDECHGGWMTLRSDYSVVRLEKF